jgi:alanine transaminase
MYAFPSIRFSEKVKQKAAEAGMQPDTYYCMEVLKNTGIVLVPGKY